MLDQLVHILVPQVGVLVLEIRSHGHDNVVGAVVFGLEETVSKTSQTHLFSPIANPSPRSIPCYQGFATFGNVSLAFLSLHCPKQFGSGAKLSPMSSNLCSCSTQKIGQEIMHVVLIAGIVHDGVVGAGLIPAERHGRVVAIW